MKRKPLKRGAPLKPGKPLERKTPLKATTPLKAGKSLRARPKAKRSEEEAALSLRWYLIVAKGRACLKCGSKDHVQGHHILAQQFLRRLARTLGIEAMVLLWDIRIGMPLCGRCHSRHTTRTEPITRNLLPDAAFEFAVQYGCRPRLERDYPV